MWDIINLNSYQKGLKLLETILETSIFSWTSTPLALDRIRMLQVRARPVPRTFYQY